MRDASTIATLKEFLAAFNAHDLDAIMGFFSDDCELFMPRGSEPEGSRYVGKPLVREGLASRFAGIPTFTTGMTVTGRLAILASPPGCLPVPRRQATRSAFVASTFWSFAMAW